MRYEFDACVLDSATQQLWRDGEPVHVEPQVSSVLEYLLVNRDRVVSKIELLDEVWGDRFVSEAALTSRIKLARRACGDNGREQRIVKTVHGRGYRLVADVTIAGVARDARVAPPSDVGVTPPAVGGDPMADLTVGREPELGVLDRAIVDAGGGTRRTVFVCGGLGAGKSTLVAEFLERHDGLDEWAVARGQCVQTRGSVEPYYGLLDAVARLGHDDPELVRDTLDRVAPSWLAQLPALHDGATYDRLERRLLGGSENRMLREGVAAIDALARARPTVLVLEDLQWADDCTLDVLDVLVQRRDQAPLLVLVTARSDDPALAPMLARAATIGRATIIELGPLDRSALAELSRRRLGADVVPDDVVSVVSERSDGVPLFAAEIMSAWVRHGDLEVVDGEVRVTAPLAQLAGTVPDTLPMLIGRELAEVGDDDLVLLEACAVAGASFAAAAVAAALDEEIAAVEDALGNLARRWGLVGATGAAPWPDGTVSASYAFTHRLYRDVLADRLTPSRAAELHDRIGRRLEAGFGERAADIAAELAGHFGHTADRVRTIAYLRQAGQQAAARDAHRHAFDFLTGALDLVDQLPSGEERDDLELQVRMALGPTLVAVRGWFDDSVAANYERALELCGDRDPSPESAAARYGLATVSELQGRFERTEALLTPLLDTDDEHLVVEALELVACSTFHQGAFDRSLRNATRVLEHWDDDAYSVLMAAIAEHPAASCNSWSSLASWALGRSDESLAQARRAVELGERNLYALSTAVQQRAMLHQIRDEPEQTIEWADRCREVGREQDFPMRVIQADIYKGWALGVSGSADAGAEMIGDGLARFRAEGATLNASYYLGLQADVELHRGQALDAMALLDDALSSIGDGDRSYFYAAELHRLRARALLRLAGKGGDPTEARQALDASLETARSQGSPALALRAATDRLALEMADGDPAPWRVEVEALLQVYEDQEPTPDVERAQRLLSLV